MALRAVIMEGTPLRKAGEIRYFEVNAHTAGHALADGIIEPVATFYGREWATASVYEIAPHREFGMTRRLLGLPVARVYSLRTRSDEFLAGKVKTLAGSLHGMAAGEIPWDPAKVALAEEIVAWWQEREQADEARVPKPGDDDYVDPDEYRWGEIDE